MKNKSEKKQQGEELRNQLATVSTVILSTFQGITVEQDSQLRRSVEAVGGKYQVVKNTVAEHAAAGTQAEPLLKNLKGTNSIAYIKTDPVSLAKVLTKVAKEVPAFQFRAGLVEGRVDVRRNVRRCDAVRANAVLTELHGDRPREVDDPCLRRAVGKDPDARTDARARTDVDDRTTRVCNHVTRGAVTADHHPEEID